VTIDTDKIDETVLALLQLTLHDTVRAWKGHDWEVLNRLHRKGMIDNPVGKEKSVVLTDQGLAEKRAFIQSTVRKSAVKIHPPPTVAKRPSLTRLARVFVDRSDPCQRLAYDFEQFGR
jgi:hypothetical protein